MVGPRIFFVAATLLACACESNPDVSFREENEPQGPSAVPGAPAGLHATPGIGTVSLEWLPNGDSDAVTEYVVYIATTSWSGAWASTLPDASRTPGVACCAHTVTDLANDERYWFAVAAVNTMGEGASADPIDSIPPGWLGDIWIGTDSDDEAAGIVVDDLGNIYVAGYTAGSFPTFLNGGGVDAFVAKFAPDGSLEWLEQLERGLNQSAEAIATDGQNVFVTGSEEATSAFVWALNSSGGMIYYEMISGADTGTLDIAVDLNGAVAVSGYTAANLYDTNAGGRDAFFAVLDSNGIVDYGRQLGSTLADYARAITPSAEGGFYIAGETQEALPSAVHVGGADPFVARYDEVGNREWVHQFGTTALDVAWDVGVFDDHVYLAVESAGSLYGSNLGGSDAFLSVVEDDGDPAFMKGHRTAGADAALGVAIDTSGTVYLMGKTPRINTGSAILLAQYDQSDPFANPDNHRWTVVDSREMTLLPRSIAVRSPTALFVVGSATPEAATSDDVFVFKYNEDGTLQ